jgi:hypothetical protein
MLRRQRARILRRKALKAAYGSAALFLAWTMVASYSPRSIAPPPPSAVGLAAAEQIVSTASGTVNSLHATLYPGHRDTLKARALRAFSRPASGTPEIDPLPMLPDFDIEEDHAPRGRQLHVLLIGMDARLGHSRGRADAIHLLTVSAGDSTVRIMSVPRGTPSPLGYKNPSSNIISSVRSARGREELLRRVAALCGVDSIPYYVELGFSDALGVLELLGYEDPVLELQALRTRRRFQYGDHNRSYNQGMFVRSALLRLLPLLDGRTGELLMEAGLAIVESNLTVELCSGIAALLNDAHVAEHPERVQVDVRSPYNERIKRDADGAAHSRTVAGLSYARFKSGRGDGALRVLRRALASSRAADVTPREARSSLLPLYRQHGWLQIRDAQLRRSVRDSLFLRLREVCLLCGDETTAQQIGRVAEADDLLFGVPR